MQSHLIFRIALIAGLTILAACHPGSGAGGGKGVTISGKPISGIWLKKQEAEEFRATGKIFEICDEIRKNPKSSISNLRFIENSGAVYVYLPSEANLELKVGDIANDVLTLTPEFSIPPSIQTMAVQMIGDVLRFSAGAHILIEYVRSSDTEAGHYFAYQNSCRP